MNDEAQLNLLAGLGVKEPPSRDDVPKQTVTCERHVLAPLADAQSVHVLASRVLAMDETSLEELAVHFKRGRRTARRHHPESAGEEPTMPQTDFKSEHRRAF